MQTICIANQKGGVGKTTTATTLAALLKLKGYRTLLIDADPQCNSTDTYRATTYKTPTLYDVILDQDDPLPINDAIQHTEIGDIIASDPELKGADSKFPADGEEYFKLQEALQNLSDYDFVIIDTAPSDNKLLKNCLIAADQVVIPIVADRYSLQGLSDLNRTIVKIQKRNNPKLKIAGLLLIKYKRRQTLAREVKDALTDISTQMHTRVFDAAIRESASVQKAQAQRTTLLNYDSKSTAAVDYMAFVDELLQGGDYAG